MVSTTFVQALCHSSASRLAHATSRTLAEEELRLKGQSSSSVPCLMGLPTDGSHGGNLPAVVTTLAASKGNTKSTGSALLPQRVFSIESLQISDSALPKP